MKNGHTFVSLEDGHGEKIKVYDISNRKANRYSNDPIFELINLYRPVNRELKNQFAEIFYGSLPFRTKGLTVEQFLLMTKFIGYDSAFYNNLPYSEKRDLIERRFHKSAKRKHEIKIIIQKEKHAQYTLVSFYWKIQTETDDKEVAWSVDAEAQNRLGHRYFYGNGTGYRTGYLLVSRICKRRL